MSQDKTDDIRAVKTVESAEKFLKIMRVCISLCFFGSLIIFGLIPTDNWKLGEIEMDDGFGTIEIGLFSITDKDGREHKYSDWVNDGEGCLKDIAATSYANGAVLVAMWILVLLASVLGILGQIKPNRSKDYFVYGLYVCGYTGIINRGPLLLINAQYLKIYLYRDRIQEEKAVNSPLHWVLIFFSVVSIVTIILAAWRIHELDVDIEDGNLGRAIPIENLDDDKEDGDNAESSELRQDCDREESSAKLEPIPAAGYLLPDFSLDSYSLLFLSITKSFARRVPSKFTRIFLRFNCAVICIAHIAALFSLVSSVETYLYFDYQTEYVWIRWTATIIVEYILLGDTLNAANKALLMIFLPSSFVHSSSGIWTVINRMAVTVALFAQTAISMLLMQLVPLFLFRIEDEGKAAGILAEFTTYIVLIEIDNIAAPGIIYLTRILDNQISESFLGVVRDEFIQDTEVFNTRSRKEFLRFLLRGMAFVLIFFYTIPVLVELHVVSQKKAYLEFDNQATICF